jgi:chaperonin GroES
MNLRPLHDRVVVQRIDDAAPLPGAIIVPDSAKEKPQRGIILAAGSGKSTADGRRVPLDVKPGDTILFGKFAGQELKVDGVDVRRATRDPRQLQGLSRVGCSVSYRT